MHIPATIPMPAPPTIMKSKAFLCHHIIAYCQGAHPQAVQPLFFTHEFLESQYNQPDK